MYSEDLQYVKWCSQTEEINEFSLLNKHEYFVTWFSDIHPWMCVAYIDIFLPGSVGADN